ncbi:MAG: hypothetical protein JKY37_26945 [Nannocystaceae bacterium]|nr:hypothetical protein [Nannocystaceae bacterium]
MRWCCLMLLLPACVHRTAHPAAVAVADVDVDPPTIIEAKPVLTPLEPEPLGAAEPRGPMIAPGHRCRALGEWERPASPCIAEADGSDGRWLARIHVPHIQFQANTGELDRASLEVINGLAALLIAHPEFAQVEIQAHTDSTDSDHY